mmetsp:Transcript_1447/g.2657  ORF Transcript_1447/g.2657 Transcript_1447/m.2657 type:complete len:126 (+) Transcript_1447:2796-3173(+)
MPFAMSLCTYIGTVKTLRSPYFSSYTVDTGTFSKTNLVLGTADRDRRGIALQRDHVASDHFSKGARFVIIFVGSYLLTAAGRQFLSLVRLLYYKLLCVADSSSAEEEVWWCLANDDDGKTCYLLK